MTIKQRKALTLLGIVALMLGVGLGTIVVVMRLSTTEETVAPTAPESRPKAAEWYGGGNCTASFTVPAPAEVVLTCLRKVAYKDDSRNRPASYILTGNELTATDSLAPGQVLVFAIFFEKSMSGEVSSNTTGSSVSRWQGVAIKDVLDSRFTFMDGDNGCSYNNADRTVTCVENSVSPGRGYQKSFRVRLNSNVEAGVISNTATIVGGNDCSLRLTIALPKPVSCNDSCTSSSVCSQDLSCIGGRCRNPECSTETDCICEVVRSSCNQICKVNSDCAEGLICSSGSCRNQTCVNETDCVCPTATPTGTSTPTATATPTDINTPTVTATPTTARAVTTPTPTLTQLPEAGISLPTLAAFGGGLILVLLGILLLL